QIREVRPRTVAGCEECLASGDGWVHLRLCLTCGHVGCCDESPNRHARSHFHQTGHPIITPYLSPERWGWCYLDELRLVESSDGWEEGVRANAAASTHRRASTTPPGGLLSTLIGSLHRRNYLVGVIDDPVSAERGAHALEIYGFAPRDVVLQSSRTISDRMERLDDEALVAEAT